MNLASNTVRSVHTRQGSRHPGISRADVALHIRPASAVPLVPRAVEVSSPCELHDEIAERSSGRLRPLTCKANEGGLVVTMRIGHRSHLRKIVDQTFMSLLLLITKKSYDVDTSQLSKCQWLFHSPAHKLELPGLCFGGVPWIWRVTRPSRSDYPQSGGCGFRNLDDISERSRSEARIRICRDRIYRCRWWRSGPPLRERLSPNIKRVAHKPAMSGLITGFASALQLLQVQGRHYASSRGVDDRHVRDISARQWREYES